MIDTIVINYGTIDVPITLYPSSRLQTMNTQLHYRAPWDLSYFRETTGYDSYPLNSVVLHKTCKGFTLLWELRMLLNTLQ